MKKSVCSYPEESLVWSVTQGDRPVKDVRDCSSSQQQVHHFYQQIINQYPSESASSYCSTDEYLHSVTNKERFLITQNKSCASRQLNFTFYKRN